METWSGPIIYRSNYENGQEVKGELGRVLFLAAQIVECYSGGMKAAPLGILDHYLRAWGYSRDFQTPELLQEIHLQTREVSDLFEVRLEEEGAYLDLIEQARTELIHVSDRFIQEMLAQKKLIDSLQKEVMLDSLTGLFAYKSFHYFFSQEFQKARRYRTPFTLVLGDIDHFKQVNDTYGHLAGDQVLLELSEKLKNSLRTTDIVGRHGGEEFGLLLPNTHFKDALGVVEQLRRMIESQAFTYQQEHIRISMSFGLAFFHPDFSLSQDELFNMADKALYEAKGRGRNQICCFQESLRMVRRRLGVGAAGEFDDEIPLSIFLILIESGADAGSC